MAIDRANLYGGPGKISHNSAVLVSKDDVSLDIEQETSPLMNQIAGEYDQIVTDAIARLRFTPSGRWSDLATLFPFANPTIGARVFGDSDVTATLLGNNGDQFLLHNAAVTQQPELILNVGDTVFGQCEITGLRKNNTAPTAANSLYTPSTGETWAVPSFDPADIALGPWTCNWSGVTGFSAFQAQDGIRVTSQVNLTPVRLPNEGTLDMKVVSVSYAARMKPVGVTIANIEAALRAQGTGNGIGRRMGANAADLILTGASGSVTLKTAVLRTGQSLFGVEPLREGEYEWVTTRAFSSGTPQPLLVLA